MTIAQRILKIVEVEKISLSQFAESLKVTPAYISKIKKYPDTIPSDRIISDICRIYHINEYWLRTGMGTMYPTRTREMEIAEMTAAMYTSDGNSLKYQLMKLIAQLTPEQVHMLREIVEQLHDGISSEE
jgi:transcriptional regulator with XRE-family HTH domain